MPRRRFQGVPRHGTPAARVIHLLGGDGLYEQEPGIQIAAVEEVGALLLPLSPSWTSCGGYYHLNSLYDVR
jgi:hypothetical protein